jgi:hypothetical protein
VLVAMKIPPAAEADDDEGEQETKEQKSITASDDAVTCKN